MSPAEEILGSNNLFREDNSALMVSIRVESTHLISAGAILEAGPTKNPDLGRDFLSWSIYTIALEPALSKIPEFAQRVGQAASFQKFLLTIQRIYCDGLLRLKELRLLFSQLILSKENRVC